MGIIFLDGPCSLSFLLSLSIKKSKTNILIFFDDSYCKSRKFIPWWVSSIKKTKLTWWALSVNYYIIFDVYCLSRNSFIDVCRPSTKLRKLGPSRKSRIYIFFFYFFSYFFNKIRELFLTYMTVKINIASRKYFSWWFFVMTIKN